MKLILFLRVGISSLWILTFNGSLFQPVKYINYFNHSLTIVSFIYYLLLTDNLKYLYINYIKYIQPLVFNKKL